MKVHAHSPGIQVLNLVLILIVVLATVLLLTSVAH